MLGWSRRIASFSPSWNPETRLPRVAGIAVPSTSPATARGLASTFSLLLVASLCATSVAASPEERCEVDKPKSGRSTKKSAKADATEKSGSTRPGSTGKNRGQPDPAQQAEKERKQAERRRQLVAHIAREMRFAASKERRQAMTRILGLEPSEQSELLPTVLGLAESDADPLVREAALRLLGNLKQDRAVPALIKALDDPSAEILQAAIGSLSRLKAGAAGPRLLQLIEKRDLRERDETNSAIIRALGAIAHKPAAEFLRKGAQKSDTHVETKQSILLFLGDIRDEPSRDFLTKLAQDPEQPVLSRAYSVNSLGRIGNKSDATPLRQLIGKIRAMRNSAEQAKLSGLRFQLISALIRLGDRTVEDELLAAARDDDPLVRARAVKQLGELKLARARPLLCYKYRHDSSPGVRRAARKAILAVDGKGD